LVDPEQEHDMLHAKMQACLPAFGDFDDDEFDADDPFASEWQATSSAFQNQPSVPAFIPFALILRIDPFQKPNVRSFNPCVWE